MPGCCSSHNAAEAHSCSALTADKGSTSRTAPERALWQRPALLHSRRSSSDRATGSLCVCRKAQRCCWSPSSSTRRAYVLWQPLPQSLPPALELSALIVSLWRTPAQLWSVSQIHGCNTDRVEMPADRQWSDKLMLCSDISREVVGPLQYRPQCNI